MDKVNVADSYGPGLEITGKGSSIESRTDVEALKPTVVDNRELVLHDDDEKIQASQGFFKSWARVFQRFNVENRGIERVLPEDRSKQSVWDGLTVWLSANITAATFATGILGPIFGLNFGASAAVIILVNFFISAVVGLFGTFGPETGLRQIGMARFSFGVWGSRLITILYLCGMVGWATVNSMAGAQILQNLSNNKCKLWLGNLIIGLISMAVSALGYAYLQRYERYAWLPQLVVMCFLAGYGAKYFDASAPTPYPTPNSAAAVMSFVATVYATVAGWAGNAADYNVRMPENTNKWKLGFMVWAGNFFGIVPLELLGAAFMGATATSTQMSDAYDDSGIGGLIGTALRPLHGFGKFLMVILALSVINCNAINSYSLAFQVQNLGSWWVTVPRFIWTIIGSVVSIIFAIAGEEHFADILTSLLSIIGYYATPYFVCLCVEHFYFRKRKYPLEDWNNPAALPFGYAGIAAIVFGFVGAILSMDQTWYGGVVSKAVTGGVELGWIFSAVFGVVVFVPGRYLEMKFTGR